MHRVFDFCYKGNPPDTDLKSEAVFDKISGSYFRCVIQCYIFREEDGMFLMGQKPRRGNDLFLFPTQGGIRKGKPLLTSVEKKLMEELGVALNDKLEVVSLITAAQDGRVQRGDANPEFPTALELVRGDSEDCELIQKLLAEFPPNSFFAYVRKGDHDGCIGQCVFPVLLKVRSSEPLKVNLLKEIEQMEKDNVDPSEWHRAHKNAFWASLPDIRNSSPPVKKAMTERICDSLLWYMQEYYSNREDKVPASLTTTEPREPAQQYKEEGDEERLSKIVQIENQMDIEERSAKAYRGRGR